MGPWLLRWSSVSDGIRVDRVNCHSDQPDERFYVRSSNGASSAMAMVAATFKCGARRNAGPTYIARAGATQIRGRTGAS